MGRGKHIECKIHLETTAELHHNWQSLMGDRTGCDRATVNDLHPYGAILLDDWNCMAGGKGSIHEA